MSGVVWLCSQCGTHAVERFDLREQCRPFARKVHRESITYDAATRTIEAQNVELPANAWERRVER